MATSLQHRHQLLNEPGEELRQAVRSDQGGFFELPEVLDARGPAENCPHGCAEFYDDDLNAFAMHDSRMANIDLDQDTVTFGAEDRIVEAV